jgi:hypothetical protein
MTTTKLIKSLVIAALFAIVSAHAADNSIVIAQENGQQAFKLNGSASVLKNDQIRCARRPPSNRGAAILR